MNNSALAELMAGMWAMEPKALTAFLSKIADATGDYLTAGPAADITGFFGPDTERKSRMTIDGSMARIPIRGVLMKSVPKFFAFFGIEATSYSEISDAINAALSDDNVKSILLHVESPGGQVGGGMECADAIYACNGRKEMTAYIEDIGASGAYWLASQAKRLSANPNAMVGSIGVYTVYHDTSKMYESAGVAIKVIRSGEYKGMGVDGAPISPDQVAAMQEVVDGMAANFKAAVARGRGMSAKQANELADGRVWIAGDAKKLGLINAVEPMEKCIEACKPGVMVTPEDDTEGGDDADEEMKGDVAMTEQELKAKQAEAVAADRKLLADLKAAFPGDLAFATEQYEAGASVEQAKAAFCAVLSARIAEKDKEITALKAENDGLKAKAAKASGGAPPLDNDDSSEAATSGDFMTLAKAYKAEHKCTMAVACAAIEKSNPAAYAAHTGRRVR